MNRVALPSFLIPAPVFATPKKSLLFASARPQFATFSEAGNALNDALDQAGIFKGKSPNIARAFMQLSPMHQEMMNRNNAVGSSAARSLTSVHEQGQLGRVEEAADIAYESWCRIAFQQRFLTEEMLAKADEFIHQNPKAASDLPTTIAVISKLITKKADVFKFADVLGLPKENRAFHQSFYMAGPHRPKQHTTREQEAKEMLALILIKFALCHPGAKAKQNDDITRQLLMGERQELKELIPGRHDLQYGVVDSGSDARLSRRPLIWGFDDIRNRLVDVLKETVHENASAMTLFEFTKMKHYLRQGLDLHRLKNRASEMDKTKHVTKHFEPFLEALLVQKLCGALPRMKVVA